jgi:uncharacterized protein (DUF58 family)
MIRPTRRAVLLFALAVPLAFLLVVIDPALWEFCLDFGALVLIALGVDALLTLPRRRLVVEVSLPETLYVGEAGEIKVRLSAQGSARPATIDILAEQRGDVDRAEIRTAILLPGQPAAAALALLPRRRGRVHVDGLWLRWKGPLGLVETIFRRPVEGSVDVLPNIRGVQRAALQFVDRDAVFGIKVQRERGEGTEFDALRDYAPGLDHRVIDWKHSARHMKLLCKEFRTERNHQVVLAFDTGYLMCEPLEGVPRLDHAINAGLLLAWISLRHGDLVGTYGFDSAVRQYLQPTRGISSFARVQRAAAALDYHHAETNFTLGLAELNLRLRRRALIVLFTDFVDTVTAELLIESLQRMANRHVVIFVTLRDSVLEQTADAPPAQFQTVAEAVIAQDLLRDRRIVLEKLQRLGVHCLEVSNRALSTGLINRYLLIKQRGLI